MSLTLDPAALARFRRDLEAAAGRLPHAGARLGIAVSGGSDSVALLLLAAAAFPGVVAAATVDHGLRAEAADEAAAVAALCARIGVPHRTLAGSVPPGNLQQEARRLRYRLLADWAGGEQLDCVATAHQRDDVAESFLMRARRGAGVGGLARMRTARPLGAVRLVRPLLGWSRAELAAIAESAGAATFDDPSNRADRFDRSRIRRLLASGGELPPARLALAAANLRHAEDALAWTAARAWAERVVAGAGEVRIDSTGLPYEIRRRLARRAVEQVRLWAGIAGEWAGTGLDRLVAALDCGETGTIAGVKARAKHGEWRFSAAPPRRSH